MSGIWDVDYLELLPPRENISERARNLKRLAYEHYWYDYTHISYCREHLSSYLDRLDARKRTSKMHKAYHRKKRGW